MIHKIDAAKEIKKRIQAVKDDIGLLTFKETPTEVAKVEQMPICFLSYGVDKVVKRTSRTPGRNKSNPDIRSAEIVLEFVAKKSSNIINIYKTVRDAVLDDPFPLKDVNGVAFPSTYITENRTEGPVGYGLPDVEAMILVIELVYPD